MPAIQNSLNWLSLALSAILLWRLYRERLHSIYPWFFVLLLLDTARTVVLLQIPQRTNLYTIVFFGTAPLVWAANFLVLRELLFKVLHDHKGIVSVALQAMYVLFGLAVVVSIAVSWPELQSQQSAQYRYLMAMFIVHRVVFGTLLLLLLSLGGFLAWFPVRLRRNLIYYAVGFLVYFFGTAVLLLVHNVLGAKLAMALSNVNLLVSNIVRVFWIVKLRASGEDMSISIGRRWNREQAEEAVRQLESINDALARASRKVNLPKESTSV